MAKILIVDDHPLMIEGLSRIAQSIPEVTEVCTALTGTKAVELIGDNEFDLYIIDLNMPDISGFELIDLINGVEQSPRIIIHTMHEEVWYVNRMIEAGVNAIVLKSSGASELKLAVERVLKGETFACSHFAKIRSRLHPKTISRQKGSPTKRELEVLKLISEGLNTREIANGLKVTDNTVETFRKRLILKFNARNAVDLVVKAIEKGYINCLG